MTPRQKRIIGALAIANCAVILAIVLFAARFPSTTSPKPLPSPVPPDPSPGPSTGSDQVPEQVSPTAVSWQVCQHRAVQLLSRAGLGGTVSFTSGKTLRLDLVYPIPQNRDAEEAAQQVWTAFDIAQALSQDQCENFSHVTVLIQAQGSQNMVRIRASVDSKDLKAFHSGEISEDAFIDRVRYEADLLGSQ